MKAKPFRPLIDFHVAVIIVLIFFLVKGAILG